MFDGDTGSGWVDRWLDWESGIASGRICSIFVSMDSTS